MIFLKPFEKALAYELHTKTVDVDSIRKHCLNDIWTFKVSSLYPCLFIPVPTAEDKEKEERKKTIQAERKKSLQIEKEKKEQAKQEREKEKLAKIAEQAK